MNRYALILAYDGSHYHGWQKQPNANTVQEVIEARLSTVLNQDIQIVGCGRTDSGVHAKDYCAHFDSLAISKLENLKYKLNKVLPADISIKNIKKVKATFHARFDALSREYKYCITAEKDIWNRGFTSLVRGEISLEKMNAGAKLLLGKKDFTSFCKVGSDNENNFCEVFECKWKMEGSTMVFTIKANRFLRNMVRAIVGTLIEVGQEKITPEAILDILDEKNRSAAKKSAEAKGLFLSKVEY
jgi:tRNA pseudouridine38-40 synthase